MKKICFVAQFSPPINGLTEAVETLYNSKIIEEFAVDKINLTYNKRILQNIFKLIFNDSEIFYYTMAQSKFGNLRDMILMLIILLKKKKIIIHLRGGYYRQLYDNDMSRLQKKLNNYVLERISAAIVCGKNFKDIFKGLVRNEKVVVIENFADEKYLISEETYINKIMRHRDEINVLYLSNFIESKGYKKVLELSKLFNGNKKIKFHFAGAFYKEEDRQYFLQYIADNKLCNLNYYGIVEGKLKLKLLMLSDIFILPTSYPLEGQPSSIIEAMGNGCYIMSTNHAGIPDLVASEVNGQLFDTDSIDDMQKHIMKIVDNRAFLRKISLNNRKKVMENYTEAKYISKMINIIKKVS